MRDSFKSAIAAYQFKKVAVNAWGLDFYIRQPTDGEVQHFIKTKHEPNLAVRTIIALAVDENGKRIFDDNDTKTLAACDNLTIDRLYDMAVKLGHGAEDEKKTELRRRVTRLHIMREFGYTREYLDSLPADEVELLTIYLTIFPPVWRVLDQGFAYLNKHWPFYDRMKHPYLFELKPVEQVGASWESFARRYNQAQAAREEQRP